jgi:hypothetical protein
MKYLSETVEAINSYIEKDINIISVKSVRAFHNIKSSNRSKIGFIWRSLKYLEQQDILRVNGTTNPKKYKIVPIEKIDIKQVLKEGL